MKDILQNDSLKKMPYGVPDGYFENLKTELKMIPAQESVKTGILRRFVRYTAIAASVALLLMAGRFLTDRIAGTEDFTEEDYIVFSYDMTSTLYQEEYATDQIASAQKITEEDIIEYLIYTGVEPEELEEY